MTAGQTTIERLRPDAVPPSGPAAPPPGGRPRPRRRGGRGLLALALVAILGAGGYAGWRWYAPAEDPAVRLIAAPVQKGDVEDAVTALGQLQPRDYVDVGAQVSGQLKRIHVAVGASVQQGDLLAEIDAQVLSSRVEASRAQLQGLRAQVTDKQAQLVLAERQYERQRQLMRQNATSEDALQSAEAAVLSGRAQIEALRAQIRQTESTLKGDEATLGYTKIFAPMAGTVVSIDARQGQTLNANQQAPILMRIADLSTMTVWTQVSEADVARLKPGMDAYFTTLGRPNRRWTGTLRQLLPKPELLNNVVLYTALFDVANPGNELMTQMTAQVFFVAAAANDVPTVPVAALRPVPGERRQYAVTVLHEDGRSEERRVQIGVRNRVSAEIRSGLAEGERVVVGRRQEGAPAAAGPGQGGQQQRQQPLRVRGL